MREIPPEAEHQLGGSIYGVLQQVRIDLRDVPSLVISPPIIEVEHGEDHATGLTLWIGRIKLYDGFSELVAQLPQETLVDILAPSAEGVVSVPAASLFGLVIGNVDRLDLAEDRPAVLL